MEPPGRVLAVELRSAGNRYAPYLRDFNFMPPPSPADNRDEDHLESLWLQPDGHAEGDETKILEAAMPCDRLECLALDEDAVDLGYGRRRTLVEYPVGFDRSTGSENPCILFGSCRPNARGKHLPEVPETVFSKPLARTISRRHRRPVSRCYRSHGSGTDRAVHR